jgi:hypothetical protein
VLGAADRDLHETAAAIPGSLLPGHAALLDDVLDMTIPNRGTPASFVVIVEDARGGMTMSGGGSWRRRQAALETEPPS